MKKALSSLFLSLLAALLFSLVSLAAAQASLTRIVALPFSTGEAARPYAAGMAAALQRSLNTIDNVYVPPVGDALAVAERLQATGGLSPEALAEAFDAAVVVSGHVEASGAQAQVLIGLSGPRFPEARDLTVTGPLEDAPQLVTRVVNEVIRALGLSLSGDDRREVDGVLAQTPETAGLGAVAQASLRLQAPNRAQLEAAGQLDPGSSWVLSERARALALGGELARAQELAAQATEAAPGDAEAWVGRGVIALAAGEREAARAAFESALAVNPAHALALVGRGQLLLGSDLDSDRAQAETALRAALAAYPRLVDAYLLLASLQDAQGAVRELRRGASRVPESATLHEAIIQAALSDGEAAALSYLRQVLTERPESPPAVYALAARFSGEAQAEGARALLAQGRERYPGSGVLALAESVLLERQGDLAGAEAALREGFAELPAGTPETLEAANRLAILQARQGNLAGAQATLEEVAGEEVAGADPALQVNLAQIYIQAGQSRPAVELLDRLLQASPEDPQLWTLYGIALGRAGRYSQALTALDEAIALDPDNEDVRRARTVVEQAMSVTQGQEIELSEGASAPFEAGLAALEAGDVAAAAGEFARARAAEDSGLIAFYHGFTLQLSNQPRQALTAYERAQQDFPDNSVIANNLGYAYLQIGRLDRALEHITRAIELDESNARAHMNLGLTYFQLGRYADSVSAWERAVALMPSLEGELGELLEAARSRAN